MQAWTPDEQREAAEHEYLAQRRQYAYYLEIDPADLSATDLRAAAEEAPSGVSRTAYRLTIHSAATELPYAERAEALLLDGIRLGIAWGADATWGTITGERELETAFDEWLNDAEAWEARN